MGSGTNNLEPRANESCESKGKNCMTGWRAWFHGRCPQKISAIAFFDFSRKSENRKKHLFVCSLHQPSTKTIAIHISFVLSQQSTVNYPI